MFSPPHFSIDDPEEIAAFIAAEPFAAVVVSGPDGPVAAYAPLHPETDEAGRIIGLHGHLAANNPLLALAEDGVTALALFRGAEAYVSPSAYPSKAVHGEAVPTWNYMAAEARGRLTISREAADRRAALDQLTGLMEAGRAAPWSLDDAPADYVERLMRAIVAIRIDVTHIAAKKKLSQNKADPDYFGVAADLAARDDDGARAIARAMTQIRPSQDA
jgi:transcriptional regulator